MEPRTSKFREHLKRVASAAVPSYADCLGRPPRAAHGQPVGRPVTLARELWPLVLALH